MFDSHLKTLYKATSVHDRYQTEILLLKEPVTIVTLTILTFSTWPQKSDTAIVKMEGTSVTFARYYGPGSTFFI